MADEDVIAKEIQVEVFREHEARPVHATIPIQRGAHIVVFEVRVSRIHKLVCRPRQNAVMIAHECRRRDQNVQIVHCKKTRIIPRERARLHQHICTRYYVDYGMIGAVGEAAPCKGHLGYSVQKHLGCTRHLYARCREAL